MVRPRDDPAQAFRPAGEDLRRDLASRDGMNRNGRISQALFPGRGVDRKCDRLVSGSSVAMPVLPWLRMIFPERFFRLRTRVDDINPARLKNGRGSRKRSRLLLSDDSPKRNVVADAPDIVRDA